MSTRSSKGSVPNRARRSRLAATLLACLALSSGASCAVGPASTTTRGVQPIAVTRHAARPAIAYQDCGDRSSSFPSSLLLRSDAHVAAWLDDGLVQDNAGAFWFVYNYIDDNPLRPSAAPLSFTVPATPAYPPLQLKPKPALANDPYRNGQLLAQ